MKLSLALASAFALVVFLAHSDKGMAVCLEHNSFDTCHYAFNR